MLVLENQIDVRDQSLASLANFKVLKEAKEVVVDRSGSWIACIDEEPRRFFLRSPGNLRVWSVDEQEEVLSENAKEVQDVFFSTNGEHLVASKSILRDLHRVRAWSTRNWNADVIDWRPEETQEVSKYSLNRDLRVSYAEGENAIVQSILDEDYRVSYPKAGSLLGRLSWAIPMDDGSLAIRIPDSNRAVFSGPDMTRSRFDTFFGEAQPNSKWLGVAGWEAVAFFASTGPPKIVPSKAVDFLKPN